MSETTSESQIFTSFDHIRQRPDLYLPGAPEQAFGQLMNGIGGLLDFACQGIDKSNAETVIMIFPYTEDETGGISGSLHVLGSPSTKLIYDLLQKCVDDQKLDCSQLNTGCRMAKGLSFRQEVEARDFLSIYLLLAYSKKAKICVEHKGNKVCATFSRDKILSHSSEKVNCELIECEDNDGYTAVCRESWSVHFIPDEKYLGKCRLGSKFFSECFRRICAYGAKLHNLQLVGMALYGQEYGTKALLDMVAPYPVGEKSLEITVEKSGAFSLTVSLRPDTERRCEVLLAGHSVTGQIQHIVGKVFEDFIAKNYGDDAVPRLQPLGFAAVFSILGWDDILLLDHATLECVLPEGSRHYREINEEIIGAFETHVSLGKFLETEYGLARK